MSEHAHFKVHVIRCVCAQMRVTAECASDDVYARVDLLPHIYASPLLPSPPQHENYPFRPYVLRHHRKKYTARDRARGCIPEKRDPIGDTPACDVNVRAHGVNIARAARRIEAVKRTRSFRERANGLNVGVLCNSDFFPRLRSDKKYAYMYIRCSIFHEKLTCARDI